MSNTKIIAVDFDGCLVVDEYPKIGSPKDKVVEFVRQAQKDGYKLILWTCRHTHLLREAVMFCEDELGIVFDAINENLQEIIDKYGGRAYGGDSRKVFADIYLDDK